MLKLQLRLCVRKTPKQINSTGERSRKQAANWSLTPTLDWVGLTCQGTGGCRPPGAKRDGEDPNQHFRAADLSGLHDESSHRHNLDGLHLHISAADKLGWLLCWCEKKNVIKAVFYSPFKEKSQEKFLGLLRGAAAAVFLRCCGWSSWLLRSAGLWSEKQEKRATKSLTADWVVQKVVEAISGNRGSILKSAFPALCCPNSFFPAHRFPYTPADVPWVFSFPSLRRQIGFKFLKPSSFHPLNRPSLPPPLLRGCEKPRCTLIVPARSSIRPLITRRSTGAVNHCASAKVCLCVS